MRIFCHHNTGIPASVLAQPNKYDIDNFTLQDRNFPWIRIFANVNFAEFQFCWSLNQLKFNIENFYKKIPKIKLCKHLYALAFYFGPCLFVQNEQGPHDKAIDVWLHWLCLFNYIHIILIIPIFSVGLAL